MKTLLPPLEYDQYTQEWDRVARAGFRHFNVDTWASGRRYLSLTTLCLTQQEALQLGQVAERFGPLMDQAVSGILADTDWWAALAWPWPAIELARQEPAHPGSRASLFGRFDCLLDTSGSWQVIEYNADTPSGGREVSGLEPALARLHPRLRRLRHGLPSRLTRTIRERIDQYPRPVRCIGVVSTHTWLEDIAQAVWLTSLLRRAGMPAVVGDVNDLGARRGRITLRGQAIDALYRFYPVERLYRRAIFAGLCEAAIDGRLLLLNGLRGFLAQSKACLAWLWSNRSGLNARDCQLIEGHLPPTLLASDPAAQQLVRNGVVKHVNGREGDSVVFGSNLDQRGWEDRLLEGGYVVQQAVASPAVEDVEIDDWRREVRHVQDRYACVGAFSIGGRFGGCYTRLDGPITSARATYAATLCSPA
ncbi:MAG: glutathionylspermidine synthase family protein [Chloroflexi bacterium]|nr:glutathionylspermidine synthase family protein [Chloroflexota bacterium]